MPKPAIMLLNIPLTIQQEADSASGTKSFQGLPEVGRENIEVPCSKKKDR
jgi:hypothetical protein